MEEKGQLETLQESYKTVVERIRGLRKKGKDVFMLDIEAKTIPPKLKLIAVSESTKDINQVQNVLSKLSKEIDQLEAEEKEGGNS